MDSCQQHESTIQDQLLSDNQPIQDHLDDGFLSPRTTLTEELKSECRWRKQWATQGLVSIGRCSLVVEHLLRKQEVAGSIPVGGFFHANNPSRVRSPSAAFFMQTIRVLSLVFEET